MTQTRLTIRRPDDMHLHLRDGAMLAAVAPESARDFARAIIMPNLVPPVVTGAEAAAYLQRIRDEAHRFAITGMRAARAVRTVQEAGRARA